METKNKSYLSEDVINDGGDVQGFVEDETQTSVREQMEHSRHPGNTMVAQKCNSASNDVLPHVADEEL